ncbi:MAG: choice-of-anchor D domain-containing protein [Proteobacteria bacterium]|nr:choice-of-anchor D domain-containing protein [Pseudomonadota bacterium]
MVVVAVAWVVTGCRDPLELASTEQLTVVLNPSIVSFPTTVVGQTSAAIAITIDPGAGNQDDTITEITESCPDFAITTPGLPASVYRVCEPDCGGMPCVAKVAPLACITTALQDYVFTAEFTPSIGGAQGCSVSISLNGGTSFRTVSLEGTGTVPPIDISVSPSTIAFGDVRINTDSSAAPVAVRNLGGSTLTVSATSVSAGFTLAGALAFAVAAGGAEALDVTCHPTAVGDQPGTLTIESDDPDQPILSIPLA